MCLTVGGESQTKGRKKPLIGHSRGHARAGSPWVPPPSNGSESRLGNIRLAFFFFFFFHLFAQEDPFVMAGKMLYENPLSGSQSGVAREREEARVVFVS